MSDFHETPSSALRPLRAPLPGRASDVRARVLIADDHDDARRLFTFMLDLDGWSCEEAADGAEAVHLAMSKPFDLILMDLRMPVLSGIDAIRQLRAHGFRAKILAVTADIMKSAESHALDAGADGYLTKPVSRAEFLRRCRELVSKGSQPQVGV